MQTFLPFESFHQSAKALDKQRLNKQLVECQQILRVLREGGAWENHPAVRMWDGHELALVQYAQACFIAFVCRGGCTSHKSWADIRDQYISESADHFMDMWARHLENPCYPSWLGREDVHSSHRARLLHKGNLDALRRNIKLVSDKKPDEFVSFHLTRKTFLRDVTVEDFNMFRTYMDYDYSNLDWTNWYDQWGWAEEPSDEYVWPVELLT